MSAVRQRRSAFLRRWNAFQLGLGGELGTRGKRLRYRPQLRELSAQSSFSRLQESDGPWILGEGGEIRAMQSFKTLVYPPMLLRTPTAAGSAVDPQPEAARASRTVSSARWMTLPPRVPNRRRGGYPRPDHKPSYMAAFSAHRRGHASISLRADTVISVGGSGQTLGGRTLQCAVS